MDGIIEAGCSLSLIHILKICEADHIDLLIPTIDTDLLVLSQNAAKFDEIGTKVLISKPDKIAICRDKNYTADFFESCGLKAPRTVNDYQLYHGPYCLLYTSLLLRFDFAMSTIPREYLVGYVWSMPFWVTAAVVVFYGYRLYHSIWRLASVSELRRILIAYTLLIPIYVAGGFFMRLRMPTSYYIMGYIISFCMTTGIRFSYRLLRFYVNRQDNSRPAAGRDRVMIIGAGRAGQTLIKEMLSSSKMNVQVCCIIDDNPNKKGRDVYKRQDCEGPV